MRKGAFLDHTSPDSMVVTVMGKGRDKRSSPDFVDAQDRTGCWHDSVGEEVVCVKAGGAQGASDGMRIVHDGNPSENETEGIPGASASGCRESGFSAFRGEERDRHAVFSQAVTRALLGKQRRPGIVRALNVDGKPKCSHVLTAQELRFLLE